MKGTKRFVKMNFHLFCVEMINILFILYHLRDLISKSGQVCK